MSATPTEAKSGSDSARVVRLAVRVAAVMLAAGAQTDDVENAIGEVCVAFGVTNVQYAVSFSSISVSHDDPAAPRPTTLLHIVRVRVNDFSRLARVAAFLDRVRAHELDLDGATRELTDLERPVWPYSRAISYLAPPLSATGSTLIFGGSAIDAAATLAIALAVQPSLAALERSALPPFFRSVFGAAISTLLVALLVGLDFPITGGLVLTGSLLGMLPGYALVSSLRDLIDQNIVSGSARIAEALLLGAGVAGGTALGVAIADNLGVRLTIITVGQVDWSQIVSIFAALLAVGAFAVRLGVPWRYVWQAALLGAVSWILFVAVAGGNRDIQASLATFVAALFVGIVGRVLARRGRAPSALWVVPAILPLLPGLAIVLALLSPTNAERVSGIVTAATTAFVLGVGVGMGDIIVATILSVRDRVVVPAVGAVAGGVDDFIVTPVGRAVAHSRSARPTDTER
jgi:uncharacterized membrane protein YjjP (DUF1212 family)